jgi:hypothetical protein
VLARTGEPSAFADGAVLDSIEGLIVHPSGRLAFLGTREGDDTEVVWVGDASGVEEAVRFTPSSGESFENRSAATVAGGTLSRLSSVRINSHGELGFTAGFTESFAGRGPGLRRLPRCFFSPFSFDPVGWRWEALYGPGSGGAPHVRMTTREPIRAFPRDQWCSLTLLHVDDDGDLLVGVKDDSGYLSIDAWYLVPRGGRPRLLLRARQEIEVSGVTRLANAGGIAFDAALTRIAIRSAGSESTPDAILVAQVPESCRGPRCGSGRADGGR